MPEMTVEEREIREKRAKVFQGMSDIMAKMTQGIGLSVEDRTEYDKRAKKLADLDKDLERVAQFNRLSEARKEAKDTDTRGDKPADEIKTDRLYERAFLTFLRDGHTDNMTTEERTCFRVYSAPHVINRPPTEKVYRQYEDTHGNTREVGYKSLRTADIPWSESRSVLDANALTTAPNSSGISAGVTGYDAGYLIPQGFWHNLQIALKQYGGMLPYIQMLSTDSGQPMPWPTVTNV